MENDFTNSAPGPHRGKKQNAYAKIIVLLVVLGIILYAVWWFFTASGSGVIELAFNRNKMKEEDGRVNVLLLGNAGGKHAGASLTDSIIVASYDLKTNRATLFSIPRDLWLDNASAKVNTVYQAGKKQTGNGLKYAEDKIGEILGLPIQYGVRVDFNGFSKSIDLVEGIDVEVPKTFDDYNYPIEGKEEDLCGLAEKEVEMTQEQFKSLKLPADTPQQPGTEEGKKKYKVLVGLNDKIATESADFACRYEHIHFDQGKTYMDGTTALKFVRSRQGTNGEGSDFARSRRQQVVLDAFRSKVLSLETLLDPGKLFGLAATFGESFETDIEQSRFLDFYKLSKKLSGTDHVVLGDLGKGQSVFVVGAPGKYGAFVLVPKNDDWKIISDFVKLKLEGTASASLAPSPK
ncbi:MAG TPA: LCP family protein [Patescibacteria group bacterium]|nr:LCP family protein [Patescibacteria group bacterium]